MKENVLKKHYVNYHAVNEDDFFFKNLSTSDTLDKKCKICRVNFDTARMAEKHMFLYHYGTKPHIGSARVSDLLLNINRRGPITYYSINFDQHKYFYNFCSGGLVETFLDSVYKVFHPKKECKFQGYAEIVNQQRGEIILEDKRVWLTDVHNSKFFNDFVRGEIKNEIIQRVVVNGMSGSSWLFKRFQRLNVIVVSAPDARRFILN